MVLIAVVFAAGILVGHFAIKGDGYCELKGFLAALNCHNVCL